MALVLAVRHRSQESYSIKNYKLNSVFNFGSSPDEIDETKYATHDGCYIRIMATK